VRPCTASARKPEFVPEINLRTKPFGPCRKARIGVALPCFNRGRVAFVGAHQRFLRRPIPSRRATCRPRRGSVSRQTARPANSATTLTRPQTKIKTILARVLAIDPTKRLVVLAPLSTCEDDLSLCASKEQQVRAREPFTAFSHCRPSLRQKTVAGNDGARRPLPPAPAQPPSAGSLPESYDPTSVHRASCSDFAR